MLSHVIPNFVIYQIRKSLIGGNKCGCGLEWHIYIEIYTDVKLAIDNYYAVTEKNVYTK